MKSLILVIFLAPLLFGASSFTSNNSGADPVSTIDSLETAQVNWHLLDPVRDNIQGISMDKLYEELLKGKNAKKKIIVAVIDSGVDIGHEDLRGKIWTNQKEIPGNGIDDDNNGFVDDIHGWNFIGNSDGTNVEHETLEYVRIVRDYEKRFGKIKSINDLPASDRKLFEMYHQSRKKLAKEREKYEAERENIELFVQGLAISEELVQEALGKEDYTQEDLLALVTDSQDVMSAKLFLLNIYSRGFTYQDLNEVKDYYDTRLDKHLNTSFNPRVIVNDNPEDINDTSYGNNDVKGPRSDHGTFVAGIIAANRNNNLGIDGIAENVKIMVLRAVPDGDEYDKDVALAIRYAVDNGANIINMSFGKEFSPQKEMVDDALRYAEQNNVLVVHAAGNNATNIDDKTHYPTARLDDNTIAASVITVGAISKNLNYQLLGNFTNYGKNEVDIFAPGVDMVSLYPENKYNMGSGTSFSSPVVAGIAALIWSYHPELSALQVKDVLLNSVVKYPKQKVYLPNDDTGKTKKVKFSKLSKTGGIINAYEAFKYAEKLVESQVINSSSIHLN